MMKWIFVQQIVTESPTFFQLLTNLFNWKTKLVLFFMIMGIIPGAVRFKKLTAPLRLLMLLLIISFVIEYYGMILYREFGYTNPIYHIYSPVWYALIGFIYYYFNSGFKKGVIVSIVIVFLICPLLSLPLHSIRFFPSLSMQIISMLITFLSLFSFAEMLKHTIPVKITHQPLFWFNTGNLIFNTSTFVYLGFFHSIDSSIYKDALSNILFAANLFLYGCYIVAIFLDGRKQADKINE